VSTRLGGTAEGKTSTSPSSSSGLETIGELAEAIYRQTTEKPKTDDELKEKVVDAEFEEAKG
jgi:hypothetical protein